MPGQEGSSKESAVIRPHRSSTSPTTLPPLSSSSKHPKQPFTNSIASKRITDTMRFSSEQSNARPAGRNFNTVRDGQVTNACLSNQRFSSAQLTRETERRRRETTVYLPNQRFASASLAREGKRRETTAHQPNHQRFSSASLNREKRRRQSAMCSPDNREESHMLPSTGRRRFRAAAYSIQVMEKMVKGAEEAKLQARKQQVADQRLIPSEKSASNSLFEADSLFNSI